MYKTQITSHKLVWWNLKKDWLNAMPAKLERTLNSIHSLKIICSLSIPNSNSKK